MRYTIKYYGKTRWLVTMVDGVEILALTLEGLIETKKAFTSIYTH